MISSSKRLLRLTLLGIVAGTLQATPSLAQDLDTSWDIQQVADPNYINKEPTVGENGMVAWHAHGKVDPGEDLGGSAIFLWENGQLKNLTEAAIYDRAAHIHPIIRGDRVIWHTTRNDTSFEKRAFTWVLKEIQPDTVRDYPFKELPAFYANANQNTATGGSKNFNLHPELQVYTGPTTNIQQYLKLYHQPDSVKVTNIFGVVETQQNTAPPVEDTEEAFRRRLDAGEITDPFSDPRQKIARRRTLCYNELLSWSAADGLTYETWDARNDFAVDEDGDLMAWQKAKAFPFGWEIMVRKGDERHQLTVNYYYDMAPKVHKDTVVWYGWDGNDYDIYRWDVGSTNITAVTSNQFNDVSPIIGEAGIVWESSASIEPHILFLPNGKDTPIQLSENVDADHKPAMAGKYIVWQGFDGTDYEIYLYDGTDVDADGNGTVIQLTDNAYDDIEPALSGDHLVWMGYHDNWDAEIFLHDLKSSQTSRLTDNDVEDRLPKTGGGIIAWETIGKTSSEIHVAKKK